MEFLMEMSHRMQQEYNQAQVICFKYQLANKNNNTSHFSIVKLTSSSCTGLFYVALNTQKSTFVLGCYYLILQSHPVEAERSTEKRRDQCWIPGRSTEQIEYKCCLLLLLDCSSGKRKSIFFNCFETNSWYACTEGRHAAGRLCLSSQAASRTALLQCSY